MTSFDLIREPWVPVEVAGQRENLSLRDVLTRGHEIDGFATDDPLQAIAVFRQVLLPVVLDALGVPRSEEEWAARWEAGSLDTGTLGAYLDEHAGRFDLFHPAHPFAQVAGLRTSTGETKPVSLLLPAVATGNNVPLFSARTEADQPALTPAEAARALLATQCWDTAAIKSGAVGDPQVKAGKTTGNPTGPLGQLGVVVPVGRTLAETILLNTPIVPQGLRGGDRPQWRAEPQTAVWRKRPASGLLDLLTWQSRRMRLIVESGDDSPTVVTQVVLSAGDRLDGVPEYEMHTAWRQEAKPRAGQAARRPLRHRSGREAWRGLEALLETRQSAEDSDSTSLLIQQMASLQAEGMLAQDYPLQILAVGVAYGTQFSVVEDVAVDRLPLPVAALAADSPSRGFLLDVAAQADKLSKAADYLGNDLRRALGGDNLPWDKGQRLGDALIHRLTPLVRRLLAGLQRRPDLVEEAEIAWRQAALELSLEHVEPVLSDAPPAAFLGRQTGGKNPLGKGVFRLSVAEARYRRAVREILGTSSATTSESLSATEGA